MKKLLDSIDLSVDKIHLDDPTNSDDQNDAKRKKKAVFKAS